METEKDEITKRIKEKEETLRKLKMVKLHRAKVYICRNYLLLSLFCKFTQHPVLSSSFIA